MTTKVTKCNFLPNEVGFDYGVFTHGFLRGDCERLVWHRCSPRADVLCLWLPTCGAARGFYSGLIADRHRLPPYRWHGRSETTARKKTMNEDTLKGNWKQFKGKMIEQWGKLTNDDFDVIDGKREQFLGKLQERQGIARDAAEKQLKESQERHPVFRFNDCPVARRRGPAPALQQHGKRRLPHPGADSWTPLNPPNPEEKPMKFARTLIASVAAGLLATSAFAMTEPEHKAAKERISADYKADKQKCDALKANAKDELEAQYKPSPKATQKVAEARADAAYSVAKEKCDDLKGNEKDVCEKDAKAAQVKAKEDAKVAAAQAKPADNAAEKGAAVAEARKDANAEKNDANYKAAKERCDALSGDAKSKCVDDMKRMYGKS